MGSMFGDKKRLMVDMNNGIVGTFVDVNEHESETDYLYPSFVPIGKLATRKFRQPVPKSALHSIVVPQREPYAEREILFIYDHTKPSLLNLIETDVKKENERLKKQINDLQMELATARQDVIDATGGAAKAVTRAKEISGSRRDNETFGRHDFMGDI